VSDGRRLIRVSSVSAPERDDARVLARIRAVCLRLPDADEATLQDRPLFHVHRKRFALFNGLTSPPRPRWAGSGRSVHFATDPHEREALGQDARFSVSPHHGHRGWMALDLTVAPADWEEVAELLETSYRQVAPRRLVIELDERR
jgi:predicted DNA-binding protein (MmcQ/YjbR family)